MTIKVFSKRHPEVGSEVYLAPAVRQRVWYLLEEADPFYKPNSGLGWDLCYDALSDKLKKEHGWAELRAYSSREEWEEVNTKDFILRGVPRFVLDAAEIFYDLLVEETEKPYASTADPNEYQKKLNNVFDDANLPWRMLEGRIIRIDSKWLEVEIHAESVELLSVSGFEGALAEFQQARSDLSSGDHKGAIHTANLALESTIKGILNVGQEKPGVLFRKLIESGLVPDYHKGFLKAFEEQILRSVAMARNFEEGVGHGQGSNINEPPKSLADLAVNLSGVLILYLLKRHLELHPIQDKTEVEPQEDDEIPF